jgi:hypothetical protein
MLRSLWRISSSEILARFALACVAGVLAGLGVRIGAPGLTALAGIPLMVLIYRRRYKGL